MSADSSTRAAAPLLVLIVEDEEAIALALSFIVEDEGYIPLIATRGQEALELARTRRPALIITDLMMPQISGRELIAALRQAAEPGGDHTPMILMTAAGKAFAADSGADDILLKPFDIGTVTSLLHRYLR